MLRVWAMDATKPFEFIGFGAMDATKPYEFIGFGDLREDKMIYPAPDLGPIFGHLGPTAGPGSPGNGLGSENSAGCTKNQPRRPILSLIRVYFVFLGPTAKI